jgi:hypothetical protein
MGIPAAAGSAVGGISVETGSDVALIGVGSSVRMAKVGAGSVGWDGAAQLASRVNISRKISGVREEFFLINIIVYVSVYGMESSMIRFGCND